VDRVLSNEGVWITQMLIDPNKALVIVGIILSLGGLVLMIEARTYTDEKGERWSMHKPVKKKINYFGWFCTILGAILQIVGTFDGFKYIRL
jgi:hypothetical protein